MEYIIFKNPKVIYREESFGGIAYYNSKLFMLDKIQFEYLKGFIKYKYYSKMDDDERDIIDNFVDNDIFLKIDNDTIENKIKGKIVVLDQHTGKV